MKKTFAAIVNNENEAAVADGIGTSKGIPTSNITGNVPGILFPFGNMENDRLIVEAKTPTNYDGMPSISFTASEVEKLAIPLTKQ